MSDFGVRTDIQQTHVIAVVVITVLLSSADSVEKLETQRKPNFSQIPLNSKVRFKYCE